MSKEHYFKALDLYINFCNLCIDDRDFESFTLEEQNESLKTFINDFDNCTMNHYLKMLVGEAANHGEDFSDEESRNYFQLFKVLNLRSSNGIEY